MLNVLFEEIPCQETEAEAPLPRSNVEEVDGVQDLRFRDVNVDRAEVFGEAVADEDDAQVEEKPEFFVGGLEAHERMCAHAWVEIPRFEARVFGEVVNDWVPNGNVVVDEWNRDIRPTAAEDGNTREPETRWANDLTVAGSRNFDFFGAEGHKLRVDGHRRARGGYLGGRS